METMSFLTNFDDNYLKAASMVSLLSVWVLVGLFFYLNYYTKRNYFTVWTAAWLFYALWLTLSITDSAQEVGAVYFVLRQWCVGISAIFLLWGSLQFLGLPVRQTLFGLFMAFLLTWTAVIPQLVESKLIMQLPVFILMGSGSIFAGVCFFRLRKKMPFVGAGMLSLGFFLWGLYLGTYPFTQEEGMEQLGNAGFFLAAVLQLFIAVSMIVLVLEEVRFKNEQIVRQISTIQSEKESLQMQIVSSEEKCRTLFDQVRLTEGLQKAYDELRLTQQSVMQLERLRALGQMASGMAHDINNALSPIVAYSDILLTTLQDIPEKSRKHIGYIRKSGEDIAHIVARMREFYRRRDGEENLAPVNFNRVIEEVIELTRPRWRDMMQNKGIKLDMHLNLDKMVPAVPSDESELQEALTNLIFNALDAMPEGGDLTLTTRGVQVKGGPRGERKYSHIILELTDTGIGMDDKTRQRCLEPFYSTKGQRGGSGLGLAMVYGMVERHEGTIEIESEEGKGTTFRLVFPIRGVTRSRNGKSDTNAFARPLKILCVDDEPLIRELLVDSLVLFKHKVTTADCGKKALELFRQAAEERQPFEVVITDLGMPEMDGRQVANTIKAESPGTPVIMLTGWGTMMKDEGDIPAQVDGVLSKPPRVKELGDMLARVLANNANKKKESGSIVRTE
jgi:signal transduction histidine kinase/ActR/RegA family two-component response regulator